MRKTLPTWSQNWPFSLDLIRKVLRGSAELQQLGELVGPTKVYTEREADRIREAVESRNSKPKKSVAAG